MNVTQNSDGGITVEIPYADLATAVGGVLNRIPVSSANLGLHIANDLGDAVAEAIRNSKIVYDLAVTDSVAATVQTIKNTRDDSCS